MARQPKRRISIDRLENRQRRETPVANFLLGGAPSTTRITEGMVVQVDGNRLIIEKVIVQGDEVRLKVRKR